MTKSWQEQEDNIFFPKLQLKKPKTKHKTNKQPSREPALAIVDASLLPGAEVSEAHFAFGLLGSCSAAGGWAVVVVGGGGGSSSSRSFPEWEEEEENMRGSQAAAEEHRRCDWLSPKLFFFFSFPPFYSWIKPDVFLYNTVLHKPLGFFSSDWMSNCGRGSWLHCSTRCWCCSQDHTNQKRL